MNIAHHLCQSLGRTPGCHITEGVQLKSMSPLFIHLLVLIVLVYLVHQRQIGFLKDPANLSQAPSVAERGHVPLWHKRILNHQLTPTSVVRVQGHPWWSWADCGARARARDSTVAVLIAATAALIVVIIRFVAPSLIRAVIQITASATALFPLACVLAHRFGVLSSRRPILAYDPQCFCRSTSHTTTTNFILHCSSYSATHPLLLLEGIVVTKRDQCCSHSVLQTFLVLDRLVLKRTVDRLCGS